MSILYHPSSALFSKSGNDSGSEAGTASVLEAKSITENLETVSGLEEPKGTSRKVIRVSRKGYIMQSVPSRNFTSTRTRTFP